MAKGLIAYFSRAGENFVSGGIQNLPVGNTQIVANMIHKQTGAALFQIVPAEAYSEDYYICINQAKQDLQRGARPKLKAFPESLEQYKVIYLGYPNYWGTMPVCVFSFLEHYDLTGKIILPFCTHEGSGMGRSEEDIRTVCPMAEVRSGLSIKGSAVQQSGLQIQQWLKDNQINSY